VRPEDRVVELAGGEELPYDALVVALGARAVPAYEHGVMFDRELEAASFDETLGDIGAGLAPSVAIVVSPAVSWTLPGYELALMTAAWGAAARSEGVQVTLVTAESRPLEAFGDAVSDAVEEILADAGIGLLPGIDADVTSDTTVRLGRSGHWLTPDRIVALPALTGPRIQGLPQDANGFVLVDGHGRVPGTDRVYAAGDGAARPLKQGGLAAQQADVIAHTIADRLGAPVQELQPNRILRARLLHGEGALVLRTELDLLGRPTKATTEHRESRQATDLKVFGRYLTPYLSITRRSSSTRHSGRGALHHCCCGMN
jgi:sulfide:quinone oxidoreductase